MSTIVKICGITTPADGEAAAAAGADAVGLMFYAPSPRYVTVPAAAAIARALPPFIIKVGVFVDAPAELVLQAVAECGLNVLQFHGAETPEYCQSFPVMTIKAFRMKGPETLAELPTYPTSAWLLDAYTPDRHGGTGATFNWELARQAGNLGRPIFLAGGLTPENVGAAIRQVRPYAVDVSSGVEAAPGRKDPVKMRAFVGAAKGALAAA